MTHWKALTDDERDAVLASLPGAIDGFLKGWGWLQFAQAIEDKCREKNGFEEPDGPPVPHDPIPDIHRRLAQIERWGWGKVCGPEK